MLDAHKAHKRAIEERCSMVLVVAAEGVVRVCPEKTYEKGVLESMENLFDE